MDVLNKWGEEMRIGDEVYVHGYVDEIRYDDTKRVSTVIIRNDGGYFGTVPSEIDDAPTIDAVSVVRCDECKYCKEKGTSDCPSGYGYLYCTQKKSIVYEDDYCSWGEKR